jgi:hypothetical protein
MRVVSYREARPEVLTGALNDLAGGRLNNGGQFTLTAGATSTTVSRLGVAAGDLIVFAPLTANAAAELYGGTMYVTSANISKNQFVVTHANNAQVDRTFRFAFFAVLT